LQIEFVLEANNDRHTKVGVFVILDFQIQLWKLLEAAQICMSLRAVFV